MSVAPLHYCIGNDLSVAKANLRSNGEVNLLRSVCVNHSIEKQIIDLSDRKANLRSMCVNIKDQIDLMAKKKQIFDCLLEVLCHFNL